LENFIANGIFFFSRTVDSMETIEDDEKDSTIFSFFDWFSNEPLKKSDEKTKPNCPPNGIFELGPCKSGAPITVSWPMFHKADPKFRNEIDGKWRNLKKKSCSC